MKDEDLPAQKREPNWWASVSAERKVAKIEWDMANPVNEKYLESEYSTTFNPDESVSMNASLNQSQMSGFPMPLNPSFDLQALVWVSYINREIEWLYEFSMGHLCGGRITMTFAQSGSLTCLSSKRKRQFWSTLRLKWLWLDQESSLMMVSTHRSERMKTESSF